MPELPGWDRAEAVRYTYALEFFGRYLARRKAHTRKRLTEGACEPLR